MGKKILVVAAGPRKKGNSAALAQAFAKGAAAGGHEVQCVELADKELRFCRGCLACQTTGSCVIRDDMAELLPLLQGADAVAFASPVYYYSICGQLKTFLDRSNPLFTAEYAFRDIYVLLAAAEDEAYTPEGAVQAVQGWIDCYEHARLAGVVFAGGVTAAGDIAGHPELQQAYDLGAGIK